MILDEILDKNLIMRNKHKIVLHVYLIKFLNKKIKNNSNNF